MTENLQPVLKHMTRNEIAVLARLVLIKWPDRHKGMLPFLNRKEVADWIGCYVGETGFLSNIERRIYSKLKFGTGGCFVSTLSDDKVYRRFGQHPERGVTIPGVLTHHAYRQRKMFERKKDAYDIGQSYVSLKRVGTDRWVIACRTQIYPYVMRWLDDNCK